MSRIRNCFRSALAVGALAAAFAPAGAHAAVNCDRVAAPGGSDAAAGTVDAPFATAQKVADSLSAGQVGCLRAGTYTQTILRFNHSGAAGAPITLTSYPGERAHLEARILIPEDAAHITVSNLDIHGTDANLNPNPTINGDDITFVGNDVSNSHRAICFSLGDAGSGHASYVRIERNRIHDCGQMPAHNHDHGIYVDETDHVTIDWNLIYDNADRGINLYPDAQQVTIEHNVIDGNGEGVLFSGDFGHASSDVTVRDNMITNSRLRANVESWYPSGNPVGRDNMVSQNCLYGAHSANMDSSSGGFGTSGNKVVDPGYVNASAGDFRISANSPCRAMAGDVAGVVNGTMTPDQAVAPVRRIARAHIAVVAPHRFAKRAYRKRLARRALERRQRRHMRLASSRG
jgi:hypothetical protein